MPYTFSKSTQTAITVAVMFLVAATLALDIATGFRYDHWADTVMATF